MGRGNKKDPAPKPDPKPVEKSPVEAKPDPEPKPDRVFRVVPNKALTSKRGILGPGEPVSPDDFEGGEETFYDLRRRGLIS